MGGLNKFKSSGPDDIHPAIIKPSTCINVGLVC